jgi:hypothetical protein
MTYLVWLSRTAPAVWARESDSIWAYPTILFLHTLGLSLLVGFATAIDFRVLGFSTGVPLRSLRRFFRIVWTGFWINAVSGTMLLIMTPAKLANPTFDIKLLCIALGVATTVWIRREVFAPGSVPVAAEASSKGRALAAASLFLWSGAIVAGRLTAYIGNTR